MNSCRFTFIAVAYCTLISVGCTESTSDLNVHYDVSISQPHNNIISVRMQLDSVAQDEMDISMPVWTPGAYHILEHSKQVFGMQALDENAYELPIKKVDKNTWRIACKGVENVFVDYQVYARDANIRKTYLVKNGGHITGANLFMFVNGHEANQVTAEFHLPDDWKIEGALAADESNPNLFKAKSYHQLIDSPMLVGEYLETHFDIDGTAHFIGVLGESEIDLQLLAENAGKVIRLERDIFGGLPYDKYAIIIITNASPGAIEHAGGTTVSMPSGEFKYRLFDDMFTHEYFHVWNVKRIKPPAFAPYDYEAENYTDTLWFYEGLSSYHSYLFMYQLGHTTEEEYLASIANRIANYRGSTAKDFQSATESSFDAWIKHYDKSENAGNVEVDYYDKGLLIGHILNLAIADRTDGDKGIEDLFRLLWEKAQQGKTFSTPDIQATCEELTGSSFDEIFEKCVYGKGDIPFEKYFAAAGLELVIDEKKAEQMSSRGSSGLDFAYADGQKSLVVKRIIMGGPAWNDSILPGDKVFAVNGVGLEDTQAFTAEYYSIAPSEMAELTIERDGQEMIIPLVFGERTGPYLMFKKTDNPTERQLKILKLVLPGKYEETSQL